MISSLTRFFWAAWIYKVHVVAPVLKWALWAVGCDVTSHVTFSKKIKSVLRIRFHVYQISMTPTTILWTRQRRQGTTSLSRPRIQIPSSLQNLSLAVQIIRYAMLISVARLWPLKNVRSSHLGRSSPYRASKTDPNIIKRSVMQPSVSVSVWPQACT